MKASLWLAVKDTSLKQLGSTVVCVDRLNGRLVTIVQEHRHTFIDHETHDVGTLEEAFIHVRIPWASNTCCGATGMECSIKTGWRCEDV